MSEFVNCRYGKIDEVRVAEYMELRCGEAHVVKMARDVGEALWLGLGSRIAAVLVSGASSDKDELVGRANVTCGDCDSFESKPKVQGTS